MTILKTKITTEDFTAVIVFDSKKKEFSLTLDEIPTLTMNAECYFNGKNGRNTPFFYLEKVMEDRGFDEGYIYAEKRMNQKYSFLEKCQKLGLNN